MHQESAVIHLTKAICINCSRAIPYAWHSKGLSLLVTLPLVFSELLPKTYAINNPESAARRVAPLVVFFIYIFSPIIIFVRKFVQLLLSLIGLKIDPSKQILASDEIAGAIALHHSEGTVKKDARDRLLGVLDLPERMVEEIMLHRSQIEMIDADDPPKKY